MGIIDQLKKNLKESAAKLEKELEDANALHENATAPMVKTLHEAQQNLSLLKHRRLNPIPTGVDPRKLLSLKEIDTGESCYETYPCQHDVSISGKASVCMDGPDIARLYVDNHLPVPRHFKEYIDWEGKKKRPMAGGEDGDEGEEDVDE